MVRTRFEFWGADKNLSEQESHIMRDRRTFGTRRFLMTATLMAFGSLFSQSADADWDAFWHSVHVDYHRNNAWPHPFWEAASAQTRAPFQVMTHNGWRSHNTIGHELFQSSDGALTPAGRGRVQWITSQAPEHRRVVHVLRGSNQRETEARLISVRTTIDNLHFAGPPPEVVVTNTQPATVGGAWANQINRKWLDSLPAPRLPASGSGSESGAP